jgi:hypothetical protein
MDFSGPVLRTSVVVLSSFILHRVRAGVYRCESLDLAIA